MTKIGTHVGIWLGNDQDIYFQLHRFTTSADSLVKIVANSLGGYFFYSHCRTIIGAPRVCFGYQVGLHCTFRN